MSSRDTEWMILVTYARAAGAPDAFTAQRWATEAVNSGVAPFAVLCQIIDTIAEGESNE